jgi:AcrR family transcriptional regulator
VTRSETNESERLALSRSAIIATAVAIADDLGLGALTMRKLGAALGVEAMSLYNHVANKSDVLDGVVDAVFAEVELPTGPWKPALRGRSTSMRSVLNRHWWAIGLLETRTSPGPATLEHHDAVLGTLRAAGFDVAMTARAIAALDSSVYGFALQEATLPFDGADEVTEVVRDIASQMPIDLYPHLAEMTDQHVLRPGYDFGAEFAYGLDLILNGLERDLAAT